MLQIRGVEKNYPKFHLGPVDLTLPEGYIMGLVGENGAGKSTLIHSIMNLLPPEVGTVELFGRTYAKDEIYIKNQIGFVYEENCFHDRLTPKAMSNLLRLSYPSWDETTYQRLMKQFGIDEKPLNKLSKGQKAAFAFITALSHGAKLLILDEPTSGLDPIVRREMLDELRRYVEPGGRSVLFSTHITSDLEQVADLITFIHQGKIIFTQDVEELRSNFHIIKGSPEAIKTIPLLGQQARQTHVQGLYQGPIEVLDVSQLAVETASLEDIMYYLKRGDRNETHA